MAGKAKDKSEDLYGKVKRSASDTVDKMSESVDSAKRTAKNVVSDAEK